MKTDKLNPTRLAQKFRIENRLSQNEAVNIKSLLRKLNILTIFRPLSEYAYGLSLKSPKGYRFILINSNNSRGRQHFTIAHELYHLFYDENPTPHICMMDGASKTERCANSFASALLIPEEGVVEMLSDEELEKIAGGIVSYPTKNNVPTDDDISEYAKRLVNSIGPERIFGSTGH